LEESPKKVPPVAAAGQFYDFPPSETTTAGQFYDFPPESNASEQHQVLQKLSTTSGAEEPWPPLTSSVPPPSNNNKDPFAPTADPFAAVGVVAPSMPPTSDPFASGASSAEFGFVADFSSAFGAGGNPWATGAAAEAANFTNDPFAVSNFDLCVCDELKFSNKIQNLASIHAQRSVSIEFCQNRRSIWRSTKCECLKSKYSKILYNLLLYHYRCPPSKKGQRLIQVHHNRAENL
jgi:hypothetical protein